MKPWKGIELGSIAITVLAASLVGRTSLLPTAAADDDEDDRAPQGRVFSNRDVFGFYGFSFDGFLTLAVGGTPQAIPVSAVGRFFADGQGTASQGVRTLNLGGFVILEQVSAGGPYEVQPDGTVTANFEVTTVKVTGSLPPGITLPAKTIDSFSAVINRPIREIQFIGTGIANATTGAPVAAVTIRGVARRQ